MAVTVSSFFRIKTTGLVLPFCMLLFVSMSCRHFPTEPAITPSLSVEEVACEQVWVKLKLPQVNFPAAVTVWQNDKNMGIISVSSQDTMLVLRDLKPGTTYNYRLQTRAAGNGTITYSMSFTTLNPTGNLFNWDVYYFGGGYGSCDLYDAALIDENNIWAVGEIYTKDTDKYDSLGNWVDPFNVVHWDGEKWTQMRILFPSQGVYIYNTINILYGFNKNSIWFANDYYDGTKYTFYPVLWGTFTSTGTKMWGATKDDLYIACNDGTIVRYLGNGQWRWLYTGVHVPIHDVFGLYNETTGKKKVYLALSNWAGTSAHKILTLDSEDKVDSVKWGLDRSVYGIWTNKGNIFFAAGDGIFTNLNGSWEGADAIPRISTNSVRGNGVNDVFACGDFGFLAHYNGVEWHYYSELLQYADILNSITVKNDCVIAVGFKNQSAVVIRGTRAGKGGRAVRIMH